MGAIENPVMAPACRSATGLGQSVLERIGNTPLLRISKLGAEFPHLEFYGKAEWFNPGGSVKDRAALWMIREGERSGALRAGKVILDATSGNTGIAYTVSICRTTVSGDPHSTVFRSTRSWMVSWPWALRRRIRN